VATLLCIRLPRVRHNTSIAHTNRGRKSLMGAGCFEVKTMNGHPETKVLRTSEMGEIGLLISSSFRGSSGGKIGGRTGRENLRLEGGVAHGQSSMIMEKS